MLPGRHWTNLRPVVPALSRKSPRFSLGSGAFLSLLNVLWAEAWATSAELRGGGGGGGAQPGAQQSVFCKSFPPPHTHTHTH